MNILGLKLGSTAPVTPSAQPSTVDSAFSTPFLKIGKGDLTAPFVSTAYTSGGIVLFGNDNLYPQLLNQLYYQSPIHGAVCDFIKNSVIGGGYEWDSYTTGLDKVQAKAFESKYHFKSLLRALTLDMIIHARVDLKLIVTANDITFERVDPAKVRKSTNDKYAINDDWSRGQYKVEWLPKWKPGAAPGKYLMEIRSESPGQDIYPIPSYNRALNWAYLDSEISLFHKSNIQYSVFPSIAIRRPREFSSETELEKFKMGITGKQGASNAGRMMVLTGNGKDDTPEIVQINSSQNDRMFESTAKEIKENICIAHMINPSIMGVKVAGSLGNAQELEMSYAIYEKNVVMPLREHMEEIANMLIHMSGLKNSITINDYQIIDKALTSANKQTPSNNA